MNFDHICHCGAHISAGSETALAVAIAAHHNTIHVRIEKLEAVEESDRDAFERVFAILIERRLERLEDELGIGFGNGEAQSATLVFQNSNGGTMDTSASAHVNDKPLIAVLTEFDGAGGTGNKVPPVKPVQYSSSDPTVATVDPATGQLAYLKAGVTTISGVDPGNSLAASGVLTLTDAPAVSATLDFVAPA